MKRSMKTHPSLLKTTKTLPSSLPHLSPSTTFNPTTAPFPPRRILILASNFSSLSSIISIPSPSPSPSSPNPQLSSPSKSALETPPPPTSETALSVSHSPMPVVMLSFAFACPLPTARGEAEERTTEGVLLSPAPPPAEDEEVGKSQEVREAMESDGDIGREKEAVEEEEGGKLEEEEEGGSKSKVGEEMPIVALAFLALPAFWAGVSAPLPLGVAVPSPKPKADAPEMERRVAMEVVEPC